MQLRVSSLRLCERPALASDNFPSLATVMPKPTHSSQEAMIAIGRQIAVPVCYQAQHFESIGLNIVDYTMETLRDNIRSRVRVERETIEEYFAANIAAIYSNTDPMYQRMLQQVSKSLTNSIWQDSPLIKGRYIAHYTTSSGRNT